MLSEAQILINQQDAQIKAKWYRKHYKKGSVSQVNLD